MFTKRVRSLINCLHGFGGDKNGCATFVVVVFVVGGGGGGGCGVCVRVCVRVCVLSFRHSFLIV